MQLSSVHKTYWSRMVLQEVQAITAEEAARHSIAMKLWPRSTANTVSSQSNSASAAGALPLQQLSLESSQPNAAGSASGAAQEGARSALPDRAEGSGGCSTSSAPGSGGGEQNGGMNVPAAGDKLMCGVTGREGTAGPRAEPIRVLKLPPAEGAQGVISVRLCAILKCCETSL